MNSKILLLLFTMNMHCVFLPFTTALHNKIEGTVDDGIFQDPKLLYMYTQDSKELVITSNKENNQILRMEGIKLNLETIDVFPPESYLLIKDQKSQFTGFLTALSKRKKDFHFNWRVEDSINSD